MPTLASDLRNSLERVVIEARDTAEAGARAALEALAVHHHEPYPHMKPPQRKLRNQLRARARQLGDRQDASGRLGIDHMADECAYEHWHRMLFARFLAENNLLIEPDDNMAISLAEAEELAKEEGVDVWVYASRCAQVMLPQIFRPDDPLLQVPFATEHRIRLEGLLASLPTAVFTASDALGWVYQFWQSKRKDEVNRSEMKIGADEISAVTQLFTEPYMVEFLLHNTLGAWWAGKRLTSRDRKEAESEEELRKKLALPGVDWEYLRFVRADDDGGGPWRPAAGTFDGWPKAAAELRVLDPCCGSGHFLVAALHHLVPIRMAEESLAAAEAVDAVLRDNLHGLEIDERCCQIAAFALAFEAWKISGWKLLPPLNIACTGIGPQCSAEQWIKLAEESGIPMPRGGREPIQNGLLNLHHLFSQAPTLGSLIDPTELPSNLIAADYETIQPYLTAILEAEKADDETRERAIAAAGMAKATNVLAGEYTLVITNVPYLARKSHCEIMLVWADANASEARNDLATLFVLRCIGLLGKDGVASLVTPQNWFFLTTYGQLRQRILKKTTFHAAARLGPEAFDAITGHVVNIALSLIGQSAPTATHWVAGLDAQDAKGAAGKADYLRNGSVMMVPQKELLGNPDSRIVLERLETGERLSEYAHAYQGVSPADLPHYGRMFWEVDTLRPEWRRWQSTIESTVAFGGRELVLWWNSDFTDAVDQGVAYVRGEDAWGAGGVGIKQMGNLPATIYTGEVFDTNIAIIVPKKQSLLPAIWAYCASNEYSTAVRKLDRKMNVTNATLVKLPFDLTHWQKVAAETYPDGLPEPESDDPTQWLFHGYPGGSVEAASRRLEDARQDAASTFGFLDREAEIENLSGNLPHWRQEGVTYFVTFRTADSIPQTKLQQWLAEREEWLKAHPPPHDAATRREYGERFPGRFHEWLDAGYGACVLGRPDCRAIVEGALRHFAGQRYVLDEFVVMPNHVHVLTTPLAGHSLSSIVHTWKSYTSKEINKVLGQSGTLWQKESFDHILRSPEQLEKVRQYIRDNPKGKVEAASRRFQGARQDAASTLQVAVARLLGYRWPAELDDKMRLSTRARTLVAKCAELAKFTDDDGIVCIPAVRGEEPAAERLLRLLDACRSGILPLLEAAAGSRSHLDLDDWLRNEFFEEHCKLFHHRPFVWHIWDGRKRDGFHALVNYHKLCGSGFQSLEQAQRRDAGWTEAKRQDAASTEDKRQDAASTEDKRQDAASTRGRRLLESLTYAYLGDWITRQRDGVKRGEEGAEDRLAAALELQKRLEAILAGEPPFDIFVRWKPLAEQPIGWEPDINDGVRMNIRPFLASDLPGGKKGAGVLRAKPNIKWGKDRGKEPERPKDDYPWFWGWDEKTEDFLGGTTFDGNRWNACHYTNQVKQAARDAAGKGRP